MWLPCAGSCWSSNSTVLCKDFNITIFLIKLFNLTFPCTQPVFTLKLEFNLWHIQLDWGSQTLVVWLMHQIAEDNTNFSGMSILFSTVPLGVLLSSMPWQFPLSACAKPINKAVKMHQGNPIPLISNMPEAEIPRVTTGVALTSGTGLCDVGGVGNRCAWECLSHTLNVLNTVFLY